MENSTDEDEVEYEQNIIEKVINTLLCRSDLAQQRFKAKPVSLLQLFRFATRFDIFLVVVGVVLAVLIGIGLPIVSVIQGQIISVFILSTKNQQFDTFWHSAFMNVILFICFGVASAVISYIQYVCFKNASVSIVRNARSKYMQSLLKQDATWFDSQKADTLTSQLNENIDKIRDGIGDKVGFVIRNCVMFVTCAVIDFIYNWRITLVMIGLAPVSAILMSLSSKLLNKVSVEQMDQNAQCAAIMEEAIMNFKTIASLNGQTTVLNKYSKWLREASKNGIQIAVISGVFDGLFYFALCVFYGAGFYYGGYLYKVGIVTDPGEVFIACESIVFGGYLLGILSPNLMAITNAKVAAAVVYQTIDRMPPIDSSSKEGIEITDSEGSIQFSDVHFAYETQKEHNVFSGLTFSVKAGDTVALVGHSGCGKSTVIGLLTHLYECTKGSVTIDGVDVRKIQIKSLRQMVGVVRQEPVLFSGTIKENVQFGRRDATDKEIFECCRISNAHDFIEKLPDV